ncbi:MAG: hypothetical protein HXY34_00205 [Candidatus Thorarchaeota archaeon]|nr:hypothetical protein [Candidatus Thorarchaeota archaeon]
MRHSSFPENRSTQKSVQEESPFANLKRYFVHGLILELGLVPPAFFALAPLLELYIYSPYFPLYIVLLVVPMYMATIVLNNILCRRIWGIRPKATCLSLLGQGIAIVLILPTPVILIVVLMYELTPIAPFLLYAPAISVLLVLSVLVGHVAKNSAEEFEDEYEGVQELASIKDRHVSCPYCGCSALVRNDRPTVCPKCGQTIGGPTGAGIE